MQTIILKRNVITNNFKLCLYITNEKNKLLKNPIENKWKKFRKDYKFTSPIIRKTSNVIEECDYLTKYSILQAYGYYR